MRLHKLGVSFYERFSRYHLCLLNITQWSNVQDIIKVVLITLLLISLKERVVKANCVCFLKKYCLSRAELLN